MVPILLRASHFSSPKPLDAFARSARFVFLLAGCILLWICPESVAEDSPRLLDLRGQIVLPPRTLSQRERVSLALWGVGSPFTARSPADSRGRFRFRALRPGTYSLSIYIPDSGEILQTIEITPSFANSEGMVEKKFLFDEQSLRSKARPVPRDVVSVRELSIPVKARQQYQEAQERLRKYDVEGAVRHLQKAVVTAPQYMEALNNLGTIYYQRREYIAAEGYFRQALEQEPEAFEPLVNLGAALLALGRPQEALEINQRAQEVRPQDALANSQLGLNYYLVGNREEAIEYLDRTKELDPAHFSTPQIPLARIYLERFEEQAALRELEDFLKQHPDSPRAAEVRAMIERIRQSESSPETPELAL